MNILMVSPFDLVVERLWGPTLRLHSLAKEMISRGHTVIIAGPPPFQRAMPGETDGVPLRYFRAPLHRYSYGPTETEVIRNQINRRYRLPTVMLSRWVDLMKMVWQLRIDVVYLNRAFLETAYPAAVSSFLARVPLVYDWDDLEGLHGFTTSFHQSVKVQLMETINEVVFTKIARSTVVASRYLHDFASSLGVADDELFYAPSVADDVKFRPGNDGGEIRQRYGLAQKKVLLYCGNLMANNGVRVETMLDAFAIAAAHDPEMRLMIVGDGDLLDRDGETGVLPLRAKSLGIRDRVIFTGGVSYAGVPRYLAAADVCLALFPVNVITMAKSPLKVYEYLAAGKPVVARAVGEITACIDDGINGRLVFSDDPKEYAEKITAVLADEAVRRAMGENARRTIEERFLWSHSATEALRACEKALRHV